MANGSAPIASILMIVLWPKAWARRVPGSIVALVLGTSAVMLFSIRPKRSARVSAAFPKDCRTCSGQNCRGPICKIFFNRR